MVGSGPQKLLSIPETCSHDVQSALLGDSDFGVGFAAMKPLRIYILRRRRRRKEEFNGANIFFRNSQNGGFSKMQFAKFCLMANTSAITRRIAPFPSALFLGNICGKPLHVVAATG